MIIFMISSEIRYKIYKYKFLSYYPMTEIENDKKLKKIINYFLNSRIKYFLKHLENEQEWNEILYLHNLNRKIQENNINKDDLYYIENIIEKTVWV